MSCCVGHPGAQLGGPGPPSLIKGGACNPLNQARGVWPPLVARLGVPRNMTFNK